MVEHEARSMLHPLGEGENEARSMLHPLGERKGIMPGRELFSHGERYLLVYMPPPYHGGTLPPVHVHPSTLPGTPHRQPPPPRLHAGQCTGNRLTALEHGLPN